MSPDEENVVETTTEQTDNHESGDQDSELEFEQTNDEPEATPTATKPEKEEADPLETLTQEKERLQKQVNAFSWSKRELDKANAELTKLKAQVAKKDDEPAFTKDQLAAIVNEHKDDPNVLFQVMDELAKQSGKAATVTAEKKVELLAKQKELDGFLGTMLNPAHRDQPEVKQQVSSAKDYLNLNDHPFADVLAHSFLAFRNMPQMIQHVTKKAKADALGKKADSTRKESIKTNTPKKGQGQAQTTNTASLTAGQMEVAKKLGFKSKAQLSAYSKMLKGTGGTVTVS